MTSTTKKMTTLGNSLGVAAAILAATGCSTKHLDERISLLEQRNQSLLADLGTARSELAAMNQAKGRWDDALLAARNEADRFRQELADRPVIEDTAPGWTAVPGGAMIAIEGSVLFASGKVAVRQEARRTLDAIASTVNGEYAGKDILIFGHTDDTPIRKSGWKDNWQLSSERALSVVRYLEGNGVQSARLVACGSGEHRPVALGKSKADRSKNRRVEIFAIDPQPQSGRQ